MELVRRNEHVQKLSLKKTDLNTDSMLSLVEALSSNSVIRNVNISDNAAVAGSDKLASVSNFKIYYTHTHIYSIKGMSIISIYLSIYAHKYAHEIQLFVGGSHFVSPLIEKVTSHFIPINVGSLTKHRNNQQILQTNKLMFPLL